MNKPLLFFGILFSIIIFGGFVSASTVRFNVYQDSGSDYNLTAVNIDCDGTLYDLNNQTSPFSINFANGTYSCTFSKTNWDSNTVTVVADVNKTQTVYLDKFVYPKTFAFYATTATTSSTTAVAVQTWSYTASFGGSTNATVGCSFWANSGSVAADGTWVIQSSDNGSTWTTRGTVIRTMSSNTSAASLYLVSSSYAITDGTRYLRLTHSISQSSGSLTTNDVSCNLRTNRDQNNYLITTSTNTRTESTINSSTFSNLGAAFTFTAPFNGFLYALGSTTYRKTNTYTSSETSFRALNNSIALAEYPRYLLTNSQGPGGITELFTPASSGQVISTQYQGRSATSSARFSVNSQKYFLNQKSTEFGQKVLSGYVNNTRDWNSITCSSFYNSNKRDMEVVAVIPHKSNSATDTFQIYFNAKGSTGGTYDVNSSLAKNSFTSIDQNGMIIHQYLFKDINSTDVNICLFGKSTTGQITITGGNLLEVTTNITTTSVIPVDLNSTIIIHDLNLFQEGYPNANVDLTSNSDVDVYFDFNAQGNAIDINSAKVYYRAPVDDQNCFGVERATKICDFKQEETLNFFTGTLTDTNNYIFTSLSDDDHAYKPWVYNDEPDFFKTVDGNFALYGANRWVKALHTLVPTGPNYFYNFSFSANPPTGAYDIELYDCNNDTLDPITDSGCISVYLSYDTPKELDTFYSIRYLTNDLNQVVSNNTVNLNSDGNHWTYFRCPSCTVSDNWEINYIARNTNIDRVRNWTSTVGSSLFTTTANTHDLHYHYLISGQDNNAEWYVTLNNQVGTTFTSSVYKEPISFANEPPIPEGFNSPLTGTYYKGVVDINWNVYDPENDPLKCDFNITNSDGNLVYSITNISATNSNSLCVVSGVNISSLQGGIYHLTGIVREYTTDLNFSRSSSTNFGIDNNSPITTYSGCNSSWNSTNQTITLGCSDTNGSGCSSTQYRINSGSWTSYSTPFSVSLDGNIQIDYNSTDVVENMEITKTSFCAIDRNAPSVSAPVVSDYNSEYNSGSQLYIKGPITISSDVNDLVSGTNVSDINQSSCEYSIDGGSNWLSADYNLETYKCEKLNISLTNAQDYLFRFRVKDNVGNTGTSISSSSYINDSTAPTSSDNAPIGLVSGNISIIINSTDHLSDVNGIYYCSDEVDSCNPLSGTFVQDKNTTLVLSCVGTFCTKYVRYLAIDNLGNIEVAKSTGIIEFDNRVPDVGVTDVNEFTIYDSYIKGTGNIIGGVVNDIDLNSETKGYTINGIDYIDCIGDSNCVFTNNQIIKYGIISVDGNSYIFNTRIGHTVDDNYGYGSPTITYTGDYTAPVTSDNYNSEWFDSNITIILSATEIGSGVKNTYSCVDDTNTCTPDQTGTLVNVSCNMNTVCEKYVRYYSVDNLDNNEETESGIKSVRTKIDINKPFTSIDFSSSNWVNSAQTINFTCNDYSGSGCASTHYKINSSPVWTDGNVVTISVDGNYLLEYQSTDLIGNIEDTKSIYVAIDSTSPTFSTLDNNNIWLNAPFNIYSVDVNFEISGKESAKVRVNSGSWIDINVLGTTYYTNITSDGNNIVDFNLTDLANNSLTGTVYGLLDTNYPVTTSTSCGTGWNNDSQSITLTCTDSLSGCNHTYYELNSNESWIDSNTVGVSLDGNNIINFYSVDLAGNMELENEMYCAIDKVAPTIGSILNNDTYYSQDFNIVFDQVSFGSSEIGNALYRLNSGSWTSMFTDNNIDFNVLISLDGNNVVDYNFGDTAGNYTTGTVYGLIDRTGPLFYDANWISPTDNYTFRTSSLDINGYISKDEIINPDLNSVLISFDNEVSVVTAILTNEGGGTYSWIYNYVPGFTENRDVNIIVYATDNLDNQSTKLRRTIHYIDSNSQIIINDMNLFQDGYLTANVDLTTYSDVDVIFDFNAQGDAVDVNSAKVYYRAPVDDQNCFGVIRATKQCAWKMEDDLNFFTSTLLDTNRYNFISKEDDDHVFKAWVYNSEPDHFKTNAGSFSLYGTNRWIKALHTLVPTGPNYFYNFSFSAAPPASSKDLIYYDCNNETNDPTTDPGCLLVSFRYDTPKDEDGFYSIKYNANDQNQIEGNLNSSLNVDGNHWTYLYCPTCTVSDNWKLDYILENTNVDRARNWTSTAGSSLFTAITTTHNFHYHYLIPTQDNYAEWYVTLDNQAGTTFTSDTYREQINVGNLPPLPDGFNSPLTNNYYKGVVDINWNVYDPENDPLLCDFNIINSSDVVVYQIFDVNASNYENHYCISSFDSSGLNSGMYIIAGNSREYTTDFNFSRGSTNQFGIDNNLPITTFSGCNSSWNSTNQTITFDCSDTNGSGCSSTNYRINSGSWISYSTPFSVSLDGNNIIDYNSIDVVGNTEITKTSYCAIDTSVPIVSAPVISNYNTQYDSGSQLFVKGPISINADVNDLVSGISVSDINQSSCEYSIDGGSNWLSADYNSETYKCEKNSITLTNNQNNLFKFKVSDNVGNTSTGASSLSYISDSTAPTSSDNAPIGLVSGNISIIISSVDHLSDVNVIYYCSDEVDSCDPLFGTFVQDKNTTTNLSCGSTTCTKYVRYFAIDNLGNIEVAKSTGIIEFDNRVPDVGVTDVNEFTIYDSYIKGTGNIIGGVVSDIDLNSDTKGYTINGTDYIDCNDSPNCTFTDTNQIVVSGINVTDGDTYSFNTRVGHSTDLNYGYGSPTITYTADYNAPITTDNYDGLWHDSNVTVTLSNDETGSGTKNIYYCIDEDDSCTPTTIGNNVIVGCDLGSVCKQYLRYYSEDNLSNIGDIE